MVERGLCCALVALCACTGGVVGSTSPEDGSAPVPADGGVDATSSGPDAAPDGAARDAEIPRDPGPSDAPGGPIVDAPIVGCEDADRPARRLASPDEVCEAVDGARCWYVSPEGSDDAPGTFEQPLGKAQEAAKRVGPGDIIYLRGGVYDEDNAFVSRVNQWSNPDAGVQHAFFRAGSISLPDWAGGDNYDVASGTEEAPIVLRSFPGERACVSGAGGIGFGSLRTEIAYWSVENVTLHGAAIGIGGGRGTADAPENQTHEITVAGNEVFGVQESSGHNTGLVKVDRGDGGGPYDITIESNILHELYCRDSDGVVRGWDTMHDAQHYAAITTLSCETYFGVECGGNGALTARNNHIYHVPQAFFLKNPAVGPFHLYDNVIHDIGSMGKWSPSNITFENNLVYGGIGRIDLGGSGGSAETTGVYERMGRNLTVRNNTFIGMNTLVHFRIYASGHTVEGNIIQGLFSMDQADWDHMGYIFQSQGWVNPDMEPNIELSQLARENTFDDNCFITPNHDFLAYGRRFDPGTGTELTHLSLEDARTRLSYELTSDVVDSLEEALVEPTTGDYRVRVDGPCAGRGATPPDWARSIP